MHGKGELVRDESVAFVVAMVDCTVVDYVHLKYALYCCEKAGSIEFTQKR